MFDFLKRNKIVGILTFLIVIGMLIFNVFHYTSTYGIVEINSINALFLVPFIVLVSWLGIQIGTSKGKDEFNFAYQNRLSPREKEVIALILMGKKNKEISEELFVDLSTVKSHINKIYKKTGIKNRKELLFKGSSVVEKEGNE